MRSKPPLSEPPQDEIYRTTFVVEGQGTKMPQMKTGEYTIGYTIAIGGRYVTVDDKDGQRIGEMQLRNPGKPMSISDGDTKITATWSAKNPLTGAPDELIIRLEKI
jgi:hypothetical protein